MKKKGRQIKNVLVLLWLVFWAIFFVFDLGVITSAAF